MTLGANTVETQERRPEDPRRPVRDTDSGRGACSQRLLCAGHLKAQVILSPRVTALPICQALRGFVGLLRWLSSVQSLSHVRLFATP